MTTNQNNEMVGLMADKVRELLQVMNEARRKINAIYESADILGLKLPDLQDEINEVEGEFDPAAAWSSTYVSNVPKTGAAIGEPRVGTELPANGREHVLQASDTLDQNHAPKFREPCESFLDKPERPLNEKTVAEVDAEKSDTRSIEETVAEKPKPKKRRGGRKRDPENPSLSEMVRDFIRYRTRTGCQPFFIGDLWDYLVETWGLQAGDKSKRNQCSPVISTLKSKGYVSKVRIRKEVDGLEAGPLRWGWAINRELPPELEIEKGGLMEATK